MRRSSKILAIVFLVVAAGLVYWASRADEQEIRGQVEARLAEAVTKREQELAEQEKGIQARVAELDSALANVEEPVYRRLTAEEVDQVLRRMGVAHERTTDAQGDPKFSFKLATYDVYLFFYGCEEAGCTSLRVASCFELDGPASYDLLMGWNNQKRFSTAYRGESGSACLDTDLIVRGGIALGAVDQFLYTFRDRLGEFAAHIGY